MVRSQFCTHLAVVENSFGVVFLATASPIFSVLKLFFWLPSALKGNIWIINEYTLHYIHQLGANCVSHLVLSMQCTVGFRPTAAVNSNVTRALKAIHNS